MARSQSYSWTSSLSVAGGAGSVTATRQRSSNELTTNWSLTGDPVVGARSGDGSWSRQEMTTNYHYDGNGKQLDVNGQDGDGNTF
ncbi:MAG: hypothetical protein HYT97_05955 [Elusimicrobia bacterium]|nr:hypothetical protein [Elusimicrobiota bacterium]